MILRDAEVGGGRVRKLLLFLSFDLPPPHLSLITILGTTVILRGFLGLPPSNDSSFNQSIKKIKKVGVYINDGREKGSKVRLIYHSSSGRREIKFSGWMST